MQLLGKLIAHRLKKYGSPMAVRKAGKIIELHGEFSSHAFDDTEGYIALSQSLKNLHGLS